MYELILQREKNEEAEIIFAHLVHWPNVGLVQEKSWLEGSEEDDTLAPVIDESFKSIESLISYVQHQGESCETEVMLLRRLKDMATKKRVQIRVQ